MTSNAYFKQKSRELYLQTQNGHKEPKVTLKTPTKPSIMTTINENFKPNNKSKPEKQPPPVVQKSSRSVLRRGSVPVLPSDPQSLLQKIRNERKKSHDENSVPDKFTSISDKFTLVVLGSSNVGKTTIIKKFLEGQVSDGYEATIDKLYCKTFTIDGKRVEVCFQDTSGDGAMRSLHIANGDGFILVYSVKDRTSWDYVKLLHEEIMKKHNSRIPIVVVANKSDVDKPDVAIVETEMLVELQWENVHIETSAKYNDVTNVYVELLNQAKAAYPVLSESKSELNQKALTKRRSSTGLLSLSGFKSLSLKHRDNSSERISSLDSSNCKVQ